MTTKRQETMGERSGVKIIRCAESVTSNQREKYEVHFTKELHSASFKSIAIGKEKASEKSNKKLALKISFRY